ncbi:hypothetical protein PWT90_00221 [Aphanocladium album]|nr:hypothetical protein PWT90_00221 [Aphanocladium album]
MHQSAPVKIWPARLSCLMPCSMGTARLVANTQGDRAFYAPHNKPVRGSLRLVATLTSSVVYSHTKRRLSESFKFSQPLGRVLARGLAHVGYEVQTGAAPQSQFGTAPNLTARFSLPAKSQASETCASSIFILDSISKADLRFIAQAHPLLVVPPSQDSFV